MRRPFGRALDALAVDDGRGRAGLAIGLFTARHVKRVVQPIERAVMLPAAERVIHRATWRQVLGDGAPLATGAQHIDQPVHHRAFVHTALVAASFGAPDPRPDQRPFLVGQVAGIAQPAAVMPGAVLDTP
jgi:hypothetical protein